MPVSPLVCVACNGRTSSQRVLGSCPKVYMSNAVEKLICVSQPSLCLDSSKILEVHKLAEVIKAFTRVQGEEFVKKRSDAPLAEILMQDVTPLRTCTMHVSGADELHVVRR